MNTKSLINKERAKPRARSLGLADFLPLAPLINATNNFTWKNLEKILKSLLNCSIIFKIKF